jgi:hypothetical protein
MLFNSVEGLHLVLQKKTRCLLILHFNQSEGDKNGIGFLLLKRGLDDSKCRLGRHIGIWMLLLLLLLLLRR